MFWFVLFFMRNLHSVFKKQTHHFAHKSPYSQRYGFSQKSCMHVSWSIRKAEHWRIDAFELRIWRRLLRVPWTARRLNVDPKGNQPWIFIGRTDAEAEAAILCPPDGKSWLIGKDPDAGKDWGQEEKGTTEDEMLRWLHWLNAQEFEQTLGDSEGQGRLACCSLWGHKESDMTYRLNSNQKKELGTKQFSKNEYQFFTDSFKK